MMNLSKISNRLKSGIVTVLLILLGALALAAPRNEVQATNHIVEITEIMAGANGNSQLQFVELKMSDASQNLWGPQPGDPSPPGGGPAVGRARLVFFDSVGNQTGRFVFSGNPAVTTLNVLVATQAFANLPGVPIPDFIMPPEIMAINGKVCFKDNAANNSQAFPVNLCLSYGDFKGDTEGAGRPTAALPILGISSLRRIRDTGMNADFALRMPDPTNSQGASFSFTLASLVEQGRTLFLEEQFNGNGRTCGSCHRPEDNFGISPASVAALPANDPLFIADFNLNTLIMSGDTQPSDLRGVITATNGVTATVLTGKATRTYLIYGGNGLAGTVTDSQGNQGQVQSFTPGNLDQLENSALLKGGRVLFLENIDGFVKDPVMRESVHLLNVAHTGPFGHSDNIESLGLFALGAITQHAPRRLSRQFDDVPNVTFPDFRRPTNTELAAMEAFMQSILLPADQNFNLDRFATTEAQKRGRALFFGEAKCAKCHGGLVLATSDGSLPDSVANMNEAFNTGVANLAINGPNGDNLPTEPAGLAFGASTRRFHTPSLFGIRQTAPYFHDNSVATLRAAIEFYDSLAFLNSPAGQLVGPIPAVANSQKVNDLLAFLEALVEIPFEVRPSLTFGDQAVTAGPTESQLVSLTNNGPTNLTITGATLAGVGAAHFNITSQAPPGPFPPGNNRTIGIVFDPAGPGLLTATLEINVSGGGKTWAVGVALMGIGTGTPQNEAPQVTTISPTQGNNNQPITLLITGTNFLPTPGVTLGDRVLNDVSFISATRLQATVPADLPAGSRDLTVTNPDGQSAILANAFTVIAPGPQITLVLPSQALTSALPLDLDIFGANFLEGATSQLSSIPLNTIRLSDDRLRATLPAGLPVGSHDLTVTNLNGQSSTLANAITLLGAGADDLYGFEHELWTDPPTLHANQAVKIGLIVHRQGGKNVFSNVNVDFYLGDPSGGGAFIGRGTIPFLGPRQSSSTSEVDFTPPVAGSYDTTPLCAIIDPDEQFNENLESNNKLCRVIFVLPPTEPDADLLAPHVDNFTINNGATGTISQTIHLDTEASDPATSSGLGSLAFVEYLISESTGLWVPVQVSEWSDYHTTKSNHPLGLRPRAGMRYIQAWAMDRARNISLFPFTQLVNYLPPSDQVAQNQGRIYRFFLTTGQQLMARVEPLQVGDPDLYVWPPDYSTAGRPPWVSNLSGSAIDQVSITAPVSGVYQVEVFGFTTAVYRLIVTIDGHSVQVKVGGLDPNKSLPSAPLVPLESQPDVRQALGMLPSVASPVQQDIYLPLILK